MDVKYYFNIIFKKLWLVVLISTIASVLFVYFSYSNYIPKYEASSTLLVVNNNTVDVNGIPSYNDVLVDQQLVKEYKEIIKSKLIARAVIDEIQMKDVSFGDYMRDVTVNLKPDTRLLEIRASCTDPKLAYLFANKASEVFIKKASELLKVENVVLIDRADIPGSPTRFDYKKNALMGAVVGFFFAVLIIFLIEELDDTLKTIDDVENIFGLKVLGTIPDLKMKYK